MTDGKRHFDLSFLEPFRRYVPLAAWAIVILLLLVIPLKVISYGYLPADDALRHAAKAVSGKSWQEILVLGPAFHFDPNWGWHWLLGKIHSWENWDAEALVVFSLVTLFFIGNGSAVACLKRPEAWLAGFVLVALVSDLTQRFLLGRPFVLSVAAMAVILLVWQRHGSSPPKWWTVAWLTPLIACAVFLHGVWYLWGLLIAAFILAGQFRWGFLLALSWMMGTFLGSSLTGHPIESIRQALELALQAVGMHQTQLTMVSELKPSGGEINTLYLLGGLVALRHLAKLNAPPLLRHPAFWMVALGWVFGCQTSRFWEDWGAPALVILLACDLQLLFEMRLAADSFQRLALVICLAVTTYAVTTNDINSRWTNHLAWRYLTPNEPEIAGWLPDKGGTFYTVDQSLFYQTFFKNPNADWRYIIGFESTLMPEEDFKVYHDVLWNFNDAKAYKPWVDKMRLEDRLVIRGAAAAPPPIPQLEWRRGVGNVWLGRLPRPIQPGTAPPTVPAAAPRESSAQ
ncbi:MAG TPA: hypothetical protein VF430_00110 [Verrucomicrobiae bacterium]